MEKKFTEEQIAEFKAQHIADLENELEELEKVEAGLQNVLLGQGYVVVSAAGLALHYDIVGNKATNPSVARNAAYATRFSLRDAENCARITWDGNKEVAKAIHVREAVRAEIERIKGVLVFLKPAV
jgi:hypothetical protein